MIRVVLRNYEGHDLVDLRTWTNGPDGECRPGKGFCGSIKHLPQLVKTLDEALKKVRELGLIDDELSVPKFRHRGGPT